MFSRRIFGTEPRRRDGFNLSELRHGQEELDHQRQREHHLPYAQAPLEVLQQKGQLRAHLSEEGTHYRKGVQVNNPDPVG